MITLSPRHESLAGPQQGTADLPKLRGETIGRYVIRQVIGSGAEGIVYEAYDPQLGRRVGLKLLRVRKNSEASLKHLLAEAQAMALLSHPNVIRVFDAGIFEQCVYIVVEFVQGQTLTAWLRAAPRRVSEILKVFVDVGQGLSAAHQAGIIHRDFKPDNVLVTDHGLAQLTDFGLAITSAAEESQRDEARQLSPPIGTPAFMSPEQRRRGCMGPESDQFSFCLALHWALFGASPSGETPAAGRMSGLVSTPAGRVVDVKTATRRVQRAIMRGLQTDPSQRFPNMAALLDQLRPQPKPLRAVLTGAAAVFSASLVVYLLATAGRRSEPPSVAVRFYCPEGSLGTGGHCFVFQPKQQSHVDSTALCAARGGSLATCLSKGECESLELAVPSGSEAWIGLSKDVGGAPVWVTGETVLPHVRVATMEKEGAPEKPQCAFIAKGKDGTQWRWASCDESRNAVCQMPSVFQDELTGHVYRVSTPQLQYDDAHMLCKRLGGMLATVTSPREHAVIEEMLSQDITTYPVLWIGASRASAGGEFRWASGEAFSWTNFALRQPDNYEGQQDCLALDQKSHSWHDRYCSSRYQSICEFKSSTSLKH